jgi:ubiquinone biosynthesis protein COQ9
MTDADPSDAMAERIAQKDRILEASLVHAAFDGWSRRTLLQAAEDAGFDAVTARRLFPQGGDSLLAWLGDWADRRMLAATDPESLARLPVRERIIKLVRTRIEVLEDHKEAMRRAALIRGNPANLGTAGKALWRTVDRIWDAAGFPATREQGLSRYSRRVTLATVLITTVLYWLEDISPDNEETWAFLDRRIEDVMRIGQVRGQLEGLLRNVPGVGLARRAGRGRGSATAHK